MKLPISSSTIMRHLDSMSHIIDTFKSRVEKGIPGEIPAREEQVISFVQEFCAEMMIVSDTAQSLATRITLNITE